jgi:hypothetical protein
MNANRVACNYLEKLALDFNKRLELAKEYQNLGERLLHLEKRFDIDKISDTPEAKEVKNEIDEIKKRSQKILEELTP